MTGATLQILTFALADETYGIDVTSISEILEPQHITSIPRSADYLVGVMNVRGKVVPVADLRLKLGLPAVDRSNENAIIVLEIAGTGAGSHIGVLVDTVDEVTTIGADQIEPPPSVGTSVDCQFLDGMITYDGRFVMIISPERLFDQDDIVLAGQPGEQTEEPVTA